MTLFSFSSCRLSALAGAALALMAAPGWAQTDAAAPGGQKVRSLDTITVTGERIERSLRDTASSVQSISGEDLEAQSGNIASVQDALADVPNVLMPGAVGAPIIRGQDARGPNFGASAFLGGTVPRASINVDGRYLSYNELEYGGASIWDLERMEVFRGPQTVTQGANSIAGAVVVHTKDPTFQREGAAQLVAGNGGTRRASAMLSGPLAEGELAARLALDYSVRDTFIDYVNPRFAQGDTDQDFAARNARLKLLWRPARLPQLTARLTLAHAYSNRPTNEAASQPFGDFRSNALTMPSFKQWSNSAVADLAWRFDNGMELSNRTVLAHLNVRRSSEPFSNGYALIGMREVTNETKLSFGDERQPWRGALGLFVHRAHSDDLLYTNGRSDFEDRKQNLGLYGEISRRLAGKWLLSGGLRYQRDRVRRHGTTPFARAGMAYGQTFDALLPKLSLAYDISPASTVGLLLSKGYNPGGVNISFARGRVYEFGQESLRNYELFARSSLLDGRMLLTANLFFNDFHHSQRLLPDFLNGQPFGVVTVNADRARARGLELAADWQAHASLRLKAGLGLLHTRITRFTAPNGNLLENKEFSRAPRYSLSLGADWAPHPAVKLALAVRHTARYHSADDNGAAYRVPASTVVNASVSWQATRHVQVFGYVNNLFDRAISTWLYDNRTAGGIVSSMAPPRQLGLGIKAQF